SSKCIASPSVRTPKARPCLPSSTTVAAIAARASARISSKLRPAHIWRSSIVLRRPAPRQSATESVATSTVQPHPPSNSGSSARLIGVHHAHYCRQIHLVQRQARSLGEGDSTRARPRPALRLDRLRGCARLRNRRKTGDLPPARSHAAVIRFGQELSH